MTVSECCLIKLLPYILFQKYICMLALETASPENQHCADCIGTLSFPMRVLLTDMMRGRRRAFRCCLRRRVERPDRRRSAHTGPVAAPEHLASTRSPCRFGSSTGRSSGPRTDPSTDYRSSQLSIRPRRRRTSGRALSRPDRSQRRHRRRQLLYLSPTVHFLSRQVSTIFTSQQGCLRPRCCYLGSYFKRPKSSPVRPLACNWYYCA